MFLIDSGSPINTVTEEVWNEIKMRSVPVYELQNENNCQREFHSYGNTNPLKVIARFNCKLRIEHLSYETTFFVIKNATRSLISKTTGEQLGILKVGLSVSFLEQESPISEPFPLLPVRPIELHIDETIIPVKQQYYRIPAALIEKTREKLQWMLKKGIIERVHEPVDWISPMLVIPKANGDIRICVDMRAANKAIQCIKHPLPNMEHLRMTLRNYTIFTKLDLTNAYHHLPISVKSRKITTFWSNMGLLRYTRLMFGMNAAPELFQGIMEQLFCNLEGIIIYLDDILIGGMTMEDHDEKLQKVETVLEKNSLTLNKEKCEYRKTELEFIGLMISSKGIRISLRKIEAVKHFRKPETLDEVHSFLGLVNYMSSFIMDLATKTAPLRKLLVEKIFLWTSEHQKVFEELKELIVQSTLELGFFDVDQQTLLYTDASGVGLGAVLVQKDDQGRNRIITCISKSLSRIEKDYPQVHREALAIVWAVKRLYYYLMGKQFTLLTDNQALKFIFGQHKDMGKRVCNRAAMYALELQMFTYKVEHIEGKLNIADILSRMVPKESEAINSVDETTWPNEEFFAITFRRVKEEIQKDIILKKVIEALENNNWTDEDLNSYRIFKQEIYLWDNLLWKSDRIILPSALQSNALTVAHLGHPGVISMQRILRNRVWWPGMDRDIKNVVKTCQGCILVERTDPPEPLKMTIMPEKAWHSLAIDFFDATARNIHLLVIVDYHSRYVIIRHMSKDKSADEVINKLEEVFATFDYPASIKSDNGPPFNSEAFAKYCEQHGIISTHSIPLWPQSNGEVEIQNKGIKRILQIAIAQKANWKKMLQTYISMYNKRPHSTTGIPPIELLMNKKVRYLLPLEKESERNDLVTESVRENDQIKKDKMKSYTDNKRRAGESSIELEDSVLMQSKKTDKLMTNFNPTPFKVIERIGKKSKVEGPNGEIYERSNTELKKLPETGRPMRIKKPNSRYEDYVSNIE